MIVQSILNFAYGILSTLLAVLPTIDVPANAISGVAEVASLFAMFSYYVPVDTFVECSLVMVAIMNVQFLLFVGEWIINKIFDVIP